MNVVQITTDSGNKWNPPIITPGQYCSCERLSGKEDGDSKLYHKCSYSSKTEVMIPVSPQEGLYTYSPSSTILGLVGSWSLSSSKSR